MVFRKLHKKDHEPVMDFLKQEPDFNLFIIGDIENYGYEQDFQTIWGIVDKNSKIYGVLLKYYNSFIPYSYEEEVLKKFAPLITLGARVLSGKREIVEILKKHLNHDRVIEEKNECFARLNSLNDNLSLDFRVEIKKAGPEDIDRLIELRSQIKEFQGIPVNKESIQNNIKTGSGRYYFIEDEGGKIISSAATSAENSLSAMIVGVSTLPGYRQQGLATSCVYRLCIDLIEEEKTPVLFYDNPEAGKIYQRIGFERIGSWSILNFNN